MFSASTSKTRNEIHVDHFPLPSRSANLLSHTFWFLMFYFLLLTIEKLSHKIYDVPLHVVPPLDFPQIMVHLSGAWMNRISRIMGFYENLLSQLTNLWNT